MSQGPSVVYSDSAPRPVGPYSHAIRSGGFLFLSGQIGVDPATGDLVSGGVVPQTEAVLKNISSVLGTAGVGFADVVKVSIFLRDINDFPAVNAVYGRFFSRWMPARTTLGGVQLPKDALVEIDAVARLP